MKSNRQSQMDAHNAATIAGATSMFDSHLFSRSRGLALLLCLIVCGATAADAQWRTPTPRDTVYVPAVQKLWSQGRLRTNPTIQYKLSLSGTVGIFLGKDSNNFDARYCYNIPNWNAPLPMTNPPSWNGTSYNVYLQASADGTQLDSDSLRTLESFYVPSHQYTALYRGGSSIFQFRVYNRLNVPPSGFYYSQASGGINVLIAQYTPAVAVQRSTLTFPLTPVGSSKTLADSIASYGLQGLVIDSIWIGGPNASSFSVISQRGAHFTLATETTNQFLITYSPTKPENDQAVLYIHSSNANPADTLRTIVLNGSGSAPQGTLGPTTLDFGLVRIGTVSQALNVTASAQGNAPLTITGINPPSNGIFWTNYTPGPPIIAPNTAPISFFFQPAAPQQYQTSVVISTNDGKKTTITLKGEGAEPIVNLSDTLLDFGTVFTGNEKTLNATIRNDGNWTAHIVLAVVRGQTPQFFTFQPSDPEFYLDPGASRVIAVTLKPGFATDAALSASLLFYLDDGSKPKMIHLIGNEKKPRIRYATHTIDFGKVKVGATKVDSLGVTNLNNYGMGYGSRIVPSGTFFDKNTSNWSFPSGAYEMQLGFTPPMRGPLSAWMYILCDEQYDSIYLYGTGALPMPVFDPPIVDFGLCYDGTPNYGGLTVRDTGDYPLYICGFSIVGKDSAEFSVTWPTTFPDTVLDGGVSKLNISLNFTTNAHTSLTHRATLQILYCDGSMDTIPLTAKEKGAFVQFCTPMLDFGPVRVNTRKTLPASLCNSDQNVTLKVDSIWTSGVPFTVDSASLTLKPNSSQPDNVNFAPLVRGTFNGWLHGTVGLYNSDSIFITGKGVEPVPVLSKTLLDFDTVDLGASSLPQGLSLTDAGDYPLVVRVEKLGDPAEEFTVVTQSNDTIRNVRMDSVGIGAAMFYSVTFTPKFPKLPDHEAELVLHFDDSTTQVVKLIGYDRSTYLAFNEDTIDFGKVRVGTIPSPVQNVHLINTSDRPLTASTLNTLTSPFSASYTPPLIVKSYDSSAIPITFAPTGPGFVQTTLRGSGAPFLTGAHDAVVLKGIGAEPVMKLSADTLDFGIVAAGRTVPRSFTLTNAGNWPLVISSLVTGPNAADFAATVPSDTTINESEATQYDVTFAATTPIQQTPRIAYIAWTQDDGTKDTLVLIARDVQPLHVKFGFPHAYFGRPGDKIYTDFNLLTAIPDSMGIQKIQGTITFDPTVVTYIGGRAGDLVPTPNWTTQITQSVPGQISYVITSATNNFDATGTLLNLTFQLHPDVQPGASSPLNAVDSIPGTTELVAEPAFSSIFLDSTCGTIHLLTGLPITTYVQQNTPNPFGGSVGPTEIPFDIASDNTIVTLRILDMTGREIFRPIDHQSYDRGRYEIRVGTENLAAGTYFYEFQADGEKPQIKKMSVQY